MLEETVDHIFHSPTMIDFSTFMIAMITNELKFIGFCLGGANQDRIIFY